MINGRSPSRTREDMMHGVAGGPGETFSLGVGSKTRSSSQFRISAWLLAVVLGLQCVWLLLAQAVQPAIEQLPTDPSSAAAAAQHRSAAAWAASIGQFRGDLWTELAYSYAILLRGDPKVSTDPARALADARASIDRALDNAPHQSGAWLLLAGLDLLYPSPGANALAALKMSYYTAPSNQQLTALRFRITAQSNFVDDFEIGQFITRDLRLLLANHGNEAVIQGFRASAPAGRRYIEQAVKEIDPSALTWLHASVQLPPLPN